MVCSKCNEEFSKTSDVAKCAECKAEFHPGCCRVRTAAKLKGLIASGAVWQCEDCSKDTSSVGSRSDTEESTMFNMLKTIQKQIAQDNKQFKASLSSMEQSMTKVQDSLDMVMSRLCVVEEEHSKLKEKCKELEEKNVTLAKRLSDAELSIIEQEQYSRMANVEIRGIPQTGGEDIYSVLESVAGAIGVPFVRSHISIAHRLSSPRDRRFQPGIVVQFAMRSARAEWLAASKKRRLQSTDIHPSFTPGPVFINEHLSQHNKALLRRCKDGVRDRMLAYAWSKDGKVFVRKTQDSRAIRVFRSLQEIESLDLQPRIQTSPDTDKK